MDPRCHIKLFGPLCVVQTHQTLTRFRTQKAASLLAFLAVHPGPQPREQVIDLFWPDMDLAAGRGNLSTTLSSLRRQIEPPGVRAGSILVTTHAQIGLNPAAFTTDVAEFEHLCALALSSDPTRAAALLEQAAALCTGDFQPGNYQDWAVREAERLQARLVGALERLGELWESLGRFAEASETARRRLAADPYTEEAHLSLVRCLARAGRQNAAREAARRSEEFFRQEFGSGPTLAFRQATAGLLGSISGSSARPPELPTASEPAVHQAVPPADAVFPNTKTAEQISSLPSSPTSSLAASPPLPFWLSRFFGREAETAQLASLLLPPKSDSLNPRLPVRPRRLCTIVGPGGAGKTRLAAEFARVAAERFGHWCGFVPLADITLPEQISAVIIQSLRLPPSPNQSSEDQLADFFRGVISHSPALLVLDNMEHLLASETELGGTASATALIQSLLDRSPQLTVLCTSRRPLGVQGEQALFLEPLAVPDTPEQDALSDDGFSPEALAALQNVPSVRLYLDRAQMARADFGLTPVNAPAVAALCRALEGSPLALELAASWVRLLPPRKMWERMQQGMELPEGRQADLPPRQRSLSAVLEWSWRLLTEPQRNLLARLSVFRGGWSLEAAESVCEEPEALQGLADLQEASLITISPEDDAQEVRYQMLETVRSFGRRKLEEAGEGETSRRQHALLFLNRAAQTAQRLSKPCQLDALETEHDNLRAALDWAVSRPDDAEDAAQGLRLAAAMAPFWRTRGHLQEGHARLQSLLSLPAAGARTGLRAAALNRAGEIAALLTVYAEAERHHQEALVIAREIDDLPAEADARLGLGTVHYWCQEYAAAARFFEESLALRQHRERWTEPRHRDWGEAATYHSLGNLAMREKRHSDAQSFLEQALALRRQGDMLGVAGTLGSLGHVALARGDYAGAASYISETMCLFDASGQRWTAALCLSSLSDIADALGDSRQAARLLSASDRLRRQFHFPPPPAERAGYDARIAELRLHVGASVFDAAWAEGQTLSWRQIVEQTRTLQAQPSPSSGCT